MNIGYLQNRLESIKRRVITVPDLLEWKVTEYRDVILSLNRDQMLLGRDAEGNILSPSYLDDPYFKTKDAAQRYADRKYRLEASHRARIENPINYPDKDRNTPNLIIRGDFQDAMFITTTQEGFTINSTYVDAPDIDRKYNNKVFGLAPLSREYFYREYIKIAIIEHIWGALK